MNQITRTSATALAEPQPAISAELIVARLLDGKDLDQREAELLFGELVEGRLAEPLMSAAFVALRLKGETADEMTGAAFALRAAARPFPRPDYLFADSCGTGGDFSGSINVSTAAGIVAAACGLPIVKHGNRSFTSKCGSADVLEALGARLDLSPERSRQVLDETGFCFLLAPLYHPGIAHAGPVRRALKVRTIMNLLGPCLNPARPSVHLLGVAEPKLIRPVAETLKALGVERALVVHGSGLDELALHGFTEAVAAERRPDRCDGNHAGAGGPRPSPGRSDRRRIADRKCCSACCDPCGHGRAGTGRRSRAQCRGAADDGGRRDRPARRRCGRAPSDEPQAPPDACSTRS